VIVVPAASAPLRGDDRLFSYGERFRLLHAALRREIGAKRVILSTLERRRKGPNYTADTLAALEKICPQKPVVVVGADQAEKLGSWHRNDYLLEHYEFLVFARKGSRRESMPVFKGEFVEDFSEEISATQARQQLRGLSAADRFARALEALTGEIE